jgi:hypothetical protein
MVARPFGDRHGHHLIGGLHRELAAMSLAA